MLGGSRGAVNQALAGIERDCQSPRHAFWTVDVDVRKLSERERSCLLGHNQIADVQLILLAHRRRGKLATFDAEIKELAGAMNFADSVLLL
jgi:hypothetical protein